MIEDKVRTGLERFYERYPEYPRVEQQEQFEYLGVGAMMVNPMRENKVGIEVLGEYF